MATLVLHPNDTDLGELAVLLGNAGVSIHSLDFERLHARGGLAALGAPPACAVIVIPEGHPALAWLEEEPEAAAILHPPISRSSLIAALRTAGRIETMRAYQRAAYEGGELLGIARALSSERDLGSLQRLIVHKARELTGADAGSLFVIEDRDGEKRLRFAVAQTGPKDDGVLMDAMLPLATTSIAGYVSVTGNVVRIDDAYAIPEDAPYKFNRAFDDTHQYRTKSILCVPMRNLAGSTIGAIQLINNKPNFDLVLESPAHTEDVVAPFDDHEESLLLALASQAAVAMENARLVEAIQNLFEKFVHASVKAIEVRDKSTQGHSERVAALTVAQAAPSTDRKRRPRGHALYAGSAARDSVRVALTRFRQSRGSRIHLRQSQETARRAPRYDPLALPAGDRTDGRRRKPRSAARAACETRSGQRAERRRQQRRRDTARRARAPLPRPREPAPLARARTNTST